jgi:TonB family protein
MQSMQNLILEVVLRSALVAGGTWLALWLFRVRAARVRHAVWASVVVLMLALPGWTVWGPKAVLRVLKPTPVVAATQVSGVTQTWKDEAATVPAAQSTPWTLANSLLTLYLAGMSLLLLRLLIGTARARLLVRRAASVDGLLTSGSCVSPVTVGWLRPSVILPPSWKSWTESQLSAVLAHEDEHVRRRDPLVQWLALLNRAVFWFHPLSWWLERRLSSLAEEACDDAVLLRGHDPLDYSECLLGMAQVVRDSGMRISAVGMAMPGVSLPQRIRRIAAGANVERVSRARVLATAAACAVMAIVFSTTAVGYTPQAPKATAVAAQPLAQVLLAQATGDPAPPPAPPQPPPPPPPPVANVSTTVASSPQSLSGVVKDPSGAVVPNASVILSNTDTKAVLATATTDNIGTYVLGHFDPGTYNVTVKAMGFKTETQTGIQISANDTHNGGVTFLQLGTVAESISVLGSRSASASPTELGPMTTLPPSQPMAMSNPAAIEQLKALTSNYQAQYGQRNSDAKPQRIGGMVTAANLINPVRPIYPAALRIAGVQGTVKFEAIIGKDGTLMDLQMINSPDASLTQAALDAIKGWRYKPTTLNGEPVEVQTIIDVNFMLQN